MIRAQPGVLCNWYKTLGFAAYFAQMSVLENSRILKKLKYLGAFQGTTLQLHPCYKLEIWKVAIQRSQERGARLLSSIMHTLVKPLRNPDNLNIVRPPTINMCSRDYNNRLDLYHFSGNMTRYTPPPPSPSPPSLSPPQRWLLRYLDNQVEPYHLLIQWWNAGDVICENQAGVRPSFIVFATSGLGFFNIGRLLHRNVLTLPQVSHFCKLSSYCSKHTSRRTQS